MLVLPGPHCLRDCSLEHIEIYQRAAPFVERTANGCFRQVTVAVPQRVIALAVKRKVLFRGELAGVQAVSGAEWNLQSKKIFSSVPVFGKKIVALVQSHAIEPQLFAHPFVNVTGEILGRDRLIYQGQHLVIQILVIEFVFATTPGSFGCPKSARREVARVWLVPESQPCAIIVSMAEGRGGHAKQFLIFLQT